MMWGADSPPLDFGSKTEVAALARLVRSTLAGNGHRQAAPPCPFRAINRRDQTLCDGLTSHRPD